MAVPMAVEQQLQLEEIFALLLKAREGDLDESIEQRGTASPIDPRVGLFYVIPGEPRRSLARNVEMRVKYSNCVRSKVWWSPEHGNRLGLVSRTMSMKTRSEAHQSNMSFQHGFRGHWVSLLERDSAEPIKNKAVIREYVLEKCPSLVQFWRKPQSSTASVTDAPVTSAAPAPAPRFELRESQVAPLRMLPSAHGSGAQRRPYAAVVRSGPPHDVSIPYEDDHTYPLLHGRDAHAAGPSRPAQLHDMRAFPPLGADPHMARGAHGPQARQPASGASLRGIDGEEVAEPGPLVSDLAGLEIEQPLHHNASAKLAARPGLYAGHLVVAPGPYGGTTTSLSSGVNSTTGDEDDEFSLPATPVVDSPLVPSAFTDEDVTSITGSSNNSLHHGDDRYAHPGAGFSGCRPLPAPGQQQGQQERDHAFRDAKPAPEAFGLAINPHAARVPQAVIRPQTPTLVVDTGIAGTPTGRFQQLHKFGRPASPDLFEPLVDEDDYKDTTAVAGGPNRRKMTRPASSGRPTRAARHLSPGDEDYATKTLPIFREDLELALNCIMSAPSTANSDRTVEPLSDDRSSTITDDEGATVVAFDLFKKACDIMEPQEFAVWYKRHVSKLFKPAIMSRIKSCLDKNDPRVDPEFLVPVNPKWRDDRPVACAVLEGTYVDGFKMYKGSPELSKLIGCDTESANFMKLDFYDHVLESKILDLFAHLVYKKRVMDGEIKPLDYCYQCIINVSGRRFVMLCHIRWEIQEGGLCHLHSRFQDVSSDFKNILSLPPLPY